MAFLVPAVYRPNADCWNATRSCQYGYLGWDSYRYQAFPTDIRSYTDSYTLTFILKYADRDIRIFNYADTDVNIRIIYPTDTVIRFLDAYASLLVALSLSK